MFQGALLIFALAGILGPGTESPQERFDTRIFAPGSRWLAALIEVLQLLTKGMPGL